MPSSGGSKVLPPLSKALVAGDMVAPFRGGSGEGGECGGRRISLSSGMVRDPDVEAAERRREARSASDKAKKLLDERRQAQKALKAQVRARRWWVELHLALGGQGKSRGYSAQRRGFDCEARFVRHTISLVNRIPTYDG